MLTGDPAAPLILVVEENECLAEIIEASFESSSEGYRLRVVDTLQQARRAMADSPPDLVVIDAGSPEVDGDDPVTLAGAGCPVIVVAREGDAGGDAEARRGEGAVRYIAKSDYAFATMACISRQVLREWELIQERNRIRDDLDKGGKLESLGVLAGGIAHDFNNLLTVMLGHMTIAKESVPRPSTAYSSLTVAVSACDAGIRMARRLLSFAKGEALEKGALPVGDLVRECLVLLAGTVKVELDIPPELHQVQADRGQLHQVFSNLILNARQAMPDGGTLGVRAENVISRGDETGLLPGAYVRITFTDQGCGIEEEMLPHIFDPYFTTKSEGTGLGLASSDAIVVRHGGKIVVSSRKGVGSVFSVYLPAQVPEQAEEQAVRPDRTLPPREDGVRRVLVMDDEEELRSLVGTIAGHLGYQATVCCNGAEAVSLYNSALECGTPFTAVILDLVVSKGMAGKEAARRILTRDPGARLIVSSGYRNDPVMADPASYGFSAALPKPYRFKELEAVLPR